MPVRSPVLLLLALCALLVAGCATRPANTPITEVNKNSGSRFQIRERHDDDKDNLVILALAIPTSAAVVGAY